jgi:23S rRNA pseudouridine1911/1915/1917 synthase
MKSDPHSTISLFERVQALLPDSSKSHIKSLIEHGRIEVEGKRVRDKERLVAPHDRIKILPKPKYAQGGIPIIYEDRDIVVVHKREGLLSVKTDYGDEESLHQYMKMTYGASKVKVVHRLDQGTSGLLIFALNPMAFEKLKALFQDHLLDRRYLAILEGSLKEEELTLENTLYEDAAYFVHVTDDPRKGKKAITHLLRLDSKKGYTLVECRLETGRKNQIRAQTAHIGHPITGDPKYGAKRDPLNRLALHAYSLEFPHPRSGKKLHFLAPPPASFLRLFPKAKIYSEVKKS